jgi:hypothetical protein
MGAPTVCRNIIAIPDDKVIDPRLGLGVVVLFVHSHAWRHHLEVYLHDSYLYAFQTHRPGHSVRDFY